MGFFISKKARNYQHLFANLTIGTSMRILIDENIPFADAFFGEIGEVIRFAGRELAPEQLKDIDVLLVRSITKVNEQLLKYANKLTFVGTATIGEDHIDKTLLASKGIRFSSAPGCNANSVAEFVVSSLLVIGEANQINFSGKTAAIIGVGNIGANLRKKLPLLGFNLLLCDPFVQDPINKLTNSNEKWVDLETALKNADVITLHTPLTQTGAHKTFHLLNEQNLPLLKDNVCLINASRGEVIDNNALHAHIKQREDASRPPISLILDVWEGEPNPLLELIPYCAITTAHIAGYSLEGKSRGTEILYQKVCEQFGQDISIELGPLLPLVKSPNIDQTLDEKSLLKTLIHYVYDVRRDDEIFKQNLSEKGFDWIRKNYPIRREWSSISVECTDSKIGALLKSLGFQLK